MKKYTNICLLAIFTLVLSAPAFAQQGMIMLDNGIAISIKTETRPSNGPKNSYGNMFSGSAKDVIHRILTDRKNKTYLGYDLTVERIGDTKTFRVSIKPLSKGPDMLIGDLEAAASVEERNAVKAAQEAARAAAVAGGSGSTTVQTGRTGSLFGNENYKDYTARPLPNYPADIVVEEGDTITLDLLENPETNTKIADIITINNKSADSVFYVSSGKEVKSFTIDDVYLKMETPDIYINGQKYATNSTVAGNINWIYIEGKGRFIFSFKPQPRYDFQQIGVIRGEKISFEHGVDKYEIVSKSPVLGSGGNWNLWVMHDPSYRPANQLSPDSPFMFGAASKVEFLFERE
jgi:hypothetical protein